jgi:hypothetical protein
VKGKAGFCLAHKTGRSGPISRIDFIKTALPLSFGRIDGSGNDASWIKSCGRVLTADQLNKSYIQKQERNALGKIPAA